MVQVGCQMAEGVSDLLIPPKGFLKAKEINFNQLLFDER